MVDNGYMNKDNETKVADLKREILWLRHEYRTSKSETVRDSAKRYHDDLMRELRQLMD